MHVFLRKFDLKITRLLLKNLFVGVFLFYVPCPAEKNDILILFELKPYFCNFFRD